MGNGSSSRRNSQPVPYPHLVGHNGTIPPQVRMQYFPQGFSNGRYFMSMPFGTVNPFLPPLPASSPAAAEHQKVSTILNDVNVKKTTLRLEEDEENPGFYLVAFTFDAIVPGSICIFFHAREGPEFSLIPLNPNLFKPSRVSFEKGLGQKFRQAPGTGVNLSLFDPADLVGVTHGGIYPLVVRTETIPKDPPADDTSRQTEMIGAALPKCVSAQTTHCRIEMKDGHYSVKVVKQIIWVEGVRYELQEIYGIENADGGGGIENSDFGKECVICLSEQRDTTVLPCRHMCMCSACARVLQLRTNRCPICRTPVEKLLEIDISKQEVKQSIDEV